jgi:paraquat-inducible protein A
LSSLFARAALDKARIRAALGARADAAQRRSSGLSTPTALLVAAACLYVPANVYPMARIPIDLKPMSYTVLGGVFELYDSHLAGLAVLVFCASFVVPLLKMAGLSWCAVATLRRSPRALIGRTRTYRILAEAGRWSLIDPFTIACSVPVLQFNGFVFGRAEAAATPFAAVAILTTLAAQRFDPRRMWDVVGANRANGPAHD